MSRREQIKNHRVIQTIMLSYREFMEERAFHYAAALSYYTLFSLVPMILVTVFASGLIFGKYEVEYMLTNHLSNNLGPEQMAFFKNTIKNVTDFERTSLIVRVIGFAILIFTSTAMFFSLKTSIHVLWHIPFVKKNLWKLLADRGISLLMLIIVGFLIMLLFMLQSVILTSLDFVSNLLPAVETGFIFMLELLVGIIINALIFGLIYNFLPDAKISWNKLIRGSLVTSLLFTIGNILIAWYLHQIDIATTYGAMGSVMLVILWVFYSSIMIFFGAKFIFVYSRIKNDPIIMKYDKNS